MANIQVTHKDHKGNSKPLGTFSQKKKVWDYIEPDINEHFTMKIFPNHKKEYTVSKETMSRLLKEETGVVFRENGKIRYIVINVPLNPVRNNLNETN